MPTAISTSPLAPAAYPYIATSGLVQTYVAVGIIPSTASLADNLHLTDVAAVIAAEYNSAGWVRPQIQITSAGTYDSGTRIQTLPAAQVLIQALSTEPLTFRKYFTILYSSLTAATTTPRDATGTLFQLLDTGADNTIPPNGTAPLTVNITLEHSEA